MTDPTDSVASTALWMAAERARETRRPDRLFADPLGDVLAGPQGWQIMTDMTDGMPENPAFPIRTRYFDDQLLDAVHDGGIRQVVLMAAGMDSRAFRLGLPNEVTVYELDKPDLLALKEERLTDARARPTCARRTIPADLTHARHEDLETAGFSVTEPAAFVAEGLLGYLTQPDVHALLTTMAEIAFPGSVLLADVSGPSPAGTPHVGSWTARLEKAGIHRRFTTNDPEGLCASTGWTATVLEYGDETANYGRWPWPRVDRNNPHWPHNYLIRATPTDDSQRTGGTK
jgi:methyltransferase (TIGR00027 family)